MGEGQVMVCVQLPERASHILQVESLELDIILPIGLPDAIFTSVI